MMPVKLSEATPIEELNTLGRRLTWLDSDMGRIDYSLLAKPEIERNFKVQIHLMSLKEDENLSILISKTTTVQEVI